MITVGQNWVNVLLPAEYGKLLYLLPHIRCVS